MPPAQVVFALALACDLLSRGTSPCSCGRAQGRIIICSSAVRSPLAFAQALSPTSFHPGILRHVNDAEKLIRLMNSVSNLDLSPRGACCRGAWTLHGSPDAQKDKMHAQHRSCSAVVWDKFLFSPQPCGQVHAAAVCLWPS